MVDLRSDAERNRRQIVHVAGTAFAECGLHVSMREIARRADVGIATLYRRFPTRQALVMAVFEHHFAACVTAIDEALAHPDPWQGLCRMIQTVCDLQVRDRGFTEAFYATYPDPASDERHRVLRGFSDVIGRAQASEQLRSDFDPADLSLILMANSGLRGATVEDTLMGSRRLVAYLLQALRAPALGPLPPAIGLPAPQLGPPPAAGQSR